MSGYVNRVNVTFEKIGSYKILCLEYCGLTHQDMVADIFVVGPVEIASRAPGSGR